MTENSNEPTTRSDPRVDYIQEFTLKTLRLKPDKWARMIISDEQRIFISAFVEKGLFTKVFILNFKFLKMVEKQKLRGLFICIYLPLPRPFPLNT